MVSGLQSSSHEQVGSLRDPLSLGVVLSAPLLGARGSHKHGVSIKHAQMRAKLPPLLLGARGKLGMRAAGVGTVPVLQPGGATPTSLEMHPFFSF